MRKEILSLLVGITVGAIFAAAKLPIPAPDALSGVLGVAGIFIGKKIVELLINNWDKILSLIP